MSWKSGVKQKRLAFVILICNNLRKSRNFQYTKLAYCNESRGEITRVVFCIAQTGNDETERS